VTDQTKSLFQKQTPAGLIEVWNENHLRWLSIDAIEQSRINIDQPDLLASSVHRYFLAALLFKTPERVLLGALGGGALARSLYYRKPEIQGDAIEIDETIVTLAKDYFYFPAQQWNAQNYDLMIIDISEGELTPAWLYGETMLLQLKQQLSKHGVMVMNLLVEDARSFVFAPTETRKVFQRQRLCLSVPDHKNIIVIAFKQRPIKATEAELEARIKN
jgi:spermidine synthase